MDYYIIAPDKIVDLGNFNMIKIGDLRFNNLGLYQIDNISKYLESIKKNDKNRSVVVSDWTKTIMVKDSNNKTVINNQLMDYFSGLLNENMSFFICSYLTKDVLIEFVSNDINMYLRYQSLHPEFPDYSNYIICSGDKSIKKDFIKNLSKIYTVKLFIDDNPVFFIPFFDLICENEDCFVLPKLLLYNYLNINKENMIRLIKIEILLFLLKKKKIKINYKKINKLIKSGLDYTIVMKTFLNKQDYDIFFNKVNEYYSIMEQRFQIVTNNYFSNGQIIGGSLEPTNFEEKYLKYKSKYLDLKNIKYSRSSIMLMEYIKKPHSNGNLNIYDLVQNTRIILFRNSKWKKFSLPGGRIEDFDLKSEFHINKILLKTALRELQEESLNTFNFDENDITFNFIDVFDSKTGKFTRNYFILIDSEESNYFNEIYNSNKIKILEHNHNHNKVDYSWRETDSLEKFNLDIIFKCVADNELNIKNNFQIECFDINGNKQQIYYTTAQILFQTKKLMEENPKKFATIYDKIVFLTKKNYNNKYSDKFLTGTIYFKNS